METRGLGRDGLVTGAVGLGCGGMSGTYGETSDDTSIATIRAALDAGITLIDTADFYGMGHNEQLIGRALPPGDRERAVISLKFGALRDPGGGFQGTDGRPKAVANFLAYSLTRLGTGYVDIYRPARLDPDVPVEETIGAIADLVRKGYVRGIGLSEVGPETIRRAHAVHPITDLQIEYSLFSRGIENGILATCRELGIGVTAYGVLAQGLLTGSWTAGVNAAPPHLPRFHGGNLEQNLRLVDALRPVAEARGVTVAQLAIAWVLAQGPDIVALAGISKPGRVAGTVAAAGITLSAADLAAIERAVPRGAVAGERYAAPLMAMLDSER